MKGFKAFDKGMKCRDMQFEVGKTHETAAPLGLCKSGFPFCKGLPAVYNYCPKSADTLVAEVEALGDIKTDGDKSVTNKIKIVRLLTDKELLDAWIKTTTAV